MSQNLVDPELDSELRRLIARYGTPSVMAALKRLTKSKRGPKTIKDWPVIIPKIDRDARVWLSGENPVSEISNYAIAKEFAEQRPGYREAATRRRIEKKLSQSRELMKLIRAMEIGSSEYPHAAYIRTLRALCEKYNHRSWRMALDSAEASISNYEARWGERPSDQLSMDQIESKTPPSKVLSEPFDLNGSSLKLHTSVDATK